MLREVRLADEGAALRIEAHGQQVQDHVMAQVAQLGAIVLAKQRLM